MNYFKFKNNEREDSLPEIVLQAGAAADKILLFNILNGDYKRPKIKDGKSKDGMSNELVIAFKIPDDSDNNNQGGGSGGLFPLKPTPRL